MSSRKGRSPAEKRDQALRECQRRDGNKKCADCTERLPQYIVMDFNTFVCTACSGIHREFSHRIKSISLATFTDEEVGGVKKGGNNVNNALYMARYRPGADLPEPEGGRAEKHREFIRAKYVDKRWYATPDDLVRDAEREAEIAAARAKREEERKKEGKTTSRKKSTPSGSAPRSRRERTATTSSGGVGVVKPPRDVSKTPPAPKPQVDLLDFLSDDPAPPVASSTAGLTPASSTQTSAAATTQQQPWDAFGTGSGAAFTPSSVPGGVVTTPATGFALPPAAHVTNAGALPPAQQGQAAEPAWATFTDGPGGGASTATLAPVPGDGGFQANFGQPATFANSFPTGGSPRLAEAVGSPAAGQQQQQQHQQQPPQPQQPQGWASTAQLPGGVQGMSPQQQQQQPPMGLFGSPQPGQAPASTGFANGAGGVASAFEAMSLNSHQTQQQQQPGQSLHHHQGGGSYAAHQQQQPPQTNFGVGVMPHGQQHQPAQFAAQSGPFGVAPAHQAFPAFGNQGPTPGQQHQQAGQFGSGGTPGVGPSGFANFPTSTGHAMQQPQQHPGAAPMAPQQQQQNPAYAQQQQQQQQQYPQQYAEGLGGGGGTPVAAAPVNDDPFAELAEGRSGSADGSGQGTTGKEKIDEFKKGDEILYVRGTDPPLEGVVQKVHHDAGDPPFYTVLIKVTGMEKNTDHLHLRHKDQPLTAANGSHQHQPSQPRARPDAFDSIAAVPWAANPQSTLQPGDFDSPRQQHQQHQQQPQQQPPPVPPKPTAVSAPGPAQPQFSPNQHQFAQGPPVPPQLSSAGSGQQSTFVGSQNGGMVNGGGMVMGSGVGVEGNADGAGSSSVGGGNPFSTGEWAAAGATPSAVPLAEVPGGNPFDNF